MRVDSGSRRLFANFIIASACLLALLDAATAQVVTMGSVSGTVLDFDGTRVLYQGTVGSVSATALNIASGGSTTVSLIANAQRHRDYEINNSRIVVRDTGGNLVYYDTHFHTTTIGQASAIAGFSSNADIAYRVSDALYVRSSGTTALIAAPFTNVSYSGSSGYVFGDGKYGSLSGTQAVPIGTVPGTILGFNETQVLYQTTAGSAEATALNIQRGFTATFPIIANPNPGFDYLVGGGHTLIRNPEGYLVYRDIHQHAFTFDSADSIVAFADTGDFAFLRSGELYLHYSGYTIDIGTPYNYAAYENGQWFLFGGSQYAKLSDQIVALDTTFAAGATTYDASPGTVLLGVADIELSRPIVIDGPVTLNTQEHSIVMGGVLSAYGQFTKAGTGTLVLNAANTYTGNTRVAAGVLVAGDAAHLGAVIPGEVVVDSGATLKGYGKVLGAVTNNGTLEPGGSVGTLGAGSYEQGSGGTLRIDVEPSRTSSLAVTGAASLGGTLNFAFVPGSYTWQASTVLTASSISGRFSNVMSSNMPAGLLYGVGYSSHEVIFAMQSVKSGQIYSEIISTAIEDAHQLGNVLVNHERQETCGECGPVAVWAQTSVGSESRDGMAMAENAGAHWVGATIGADYVFREFGSIGVAMSYKYETISLSQRWGEAQTNRVAFAITGAAPLFNGWLDIAVFHALRSTTTHRDLVAYGATGGHPDGSSTGGTVQFRRVLVGGDIVPYAIMSAAHVNRDAAAEVGARFLNLFIAGKSNTSVRLHAGVELNHSFGIGSGSTVIPHVRVGYALEVEPNDTTTRISNAVLSGPTLEAPFAETDRSMAEVEMGLALISDSSVRLGFHGGGFIGQYSRAGEVRITCLARF